MAQVRLAAIEVHPPLGHGNVPSGSSAAACVSVWDTQFDVDTYRQGRGEGDGNWCHREQSATP